jgi:hypothetical protein
MNVEEETESTDIIELFRYYNVKYFNSRLDCCAVFWSKRMTLCAGLCTYNRGGGLCCIKLSEPLLKFRPRSDMLNTLLHEMIHAFLFVTQSNTDRDDHGPCFQDLMNRINQAEGSSISIYHSFHDEVDYYRVHWWQCDRCARIVKRAMNRAPSANDPWWAEHVRSCGGTYVKIKEPEPAEKPKGKRRKQSDHSGASDSASASASDGPDKSNRLTSSATALPPKQPSLDRFFSVPPPVPSKGNASDSSGSASTSFVPFSGRKRVLVQVDAEVFPEDKLPDSKQAVADRSQDMLPSASQEGVRCPICGTSVDANFINAHLDTTHGFS